jgi:release factor glutamine methyltransferase
VLAANLAIADIAERLRAAGCVFAEDEAVLLAEAAQAGNGDINQLVARRVAGEPLEYILGWAEFCGLRIAVEPGVFVPRRRSRRLVKEALRAAPASGPAVVVDLCCGSGAIGAAIAARRPDLDVHVCDLDPAAVHCARRNLPAERVYQGDLYDALPATLRGAVDLLVVNAPYVPTGEIGLMPREARDFEALLALDGGADGLDIQRRVAAGAPTWLRRGGALLLETSGRQAAGTQAAMAGAGLSVRLMGPRRSRMTVAIGRLDA